MNEDQTAENIIDAEKEYAYLTRCVAIVTILHERGIIDELIESGRICEEEVEQRVQILEENFPGFRELKGKQSKNPTQKGE